MNRKISKPKVWVTVGPRLEAPSAITQLIEQGVRWFRFNLSHGDVRWHERMGRRLRSLAHRRHKRVKLVFDLEGWRIRLGWFQGLIDLPNGNKVALIPQGIFTKKPRKKGLLGLPIEGDLIWSSLRPGMDVFIDDGKIWLRIIKIQSNKAYAQVIRGGEVTARKGVNIPDLMVSSASFLSQRDQQHIRLGLRIGVDAFALSFVSSARDVETVRRFIKTSHGSRRLPPNLIAKIENRQAVIHIKDIVKEADAVMVARGDLGVSLPIERLPVLQKEIIWTAQHESKPAVVATQMLDSMIHSARPTRAEVSDVGNAVFDGADGLLLSGETAVGKYPYEAVKMMLAVINECHRAMRRWRKKGVRCGRSIV